MESDGYENGTLGLGNAERGGWVKTEGILFADGPLDIGAPSHVDDHGDKVAQGLEEQGRDPTNDAFRAMGQQQLHGAESGEDGRDAFVKALFEEASEEF